MSPSRVVSGRSYCSKNETEPTSQVDQQKRWVARPGQPNYRHEIPSGGTLDRWAIPGTVVPLRSVLVVEGQARCVLDALLVQDQFDLRDQAGEF
jgi:hypothetical protein